MKNLILLFVLFATVTTAQTIDDYRDFINAQTIEYYSDLLPNRDVECSEEFGAILYTTNLLSVNGGSSCAGSCHVPSNNFAPLPGVQGSQGAVFMDKGFTICRFDDPAITKDLPEINAPVVRGVRYRNKVLSQGQATKETQPTTQFGGTAHQIDFNKLNGVAMFDHYIDVCYDDTIATEDHYVQAITDYQDGLDVYTRYTEWLRTGKSNRQIRKMVPKLWNMGCMQCHGGMGSVSEKKGHVVLNSTGKNVAGGDMVMVRPWNYSRNFTHWFWNGSYVSGSTTGLTKHVYQETGEVLSKKEAKDIINFLNKICNE